MAGLEMLIFQPKFSWWTSPGPLTVSMCMGMAGLLCAAVSLIKQKKGSEVFLSPDVKVVKRMESVKKQYNILEYLRRKVVADVCVCARFGVV